MALPGNGPTSCPQCDGPTQWSAEAASDICTECGTLVDASQSILDSHIDYEDTSGRESYTNTNNGLQFMLKSHIYGRRDRNLPGQDKEATKAAHLRKQRQQIETICTRICRPGAFARAFKLFQDAMESGEYTWGRQADLTAGAVVAIALREDGKSDALPEIAGHLGEPLTGLKSHFGKLVRTLEVKLDFSDPAHYLPALHVHLRTVLKTPDQASLPSDVLDALAPLDWMAVDDIWSNFCGLLGSISSHPVQHLPVRPTAAAIFLLALEAHLRKPLPQLNKVATVVGARYAIAAKTVMERYKTVQDIAETWIADAGAQSGLAQLGILGAYAKPPGKGSRARAGKRTVVARGLADALEMKKPYPRKVLPGLVSPSPEDADAQNPASATAIPNRVVHEAPSDAPHSKRRRTAAPMDIARQFAWDPSSVSMSDILRARGTSKGVNTARAGSFGALTEYCFRVRETSSAHGHQPTRLQLLCALRGGEARVFDEELFGEGEMERVFLEEGSEELLCRKEELTRLWDGWKGNAEDSWFDAPSAATSSLGGLGLLGDMETDADLENWKDTDLFSFGEDDEDESAAGPSSAAREDEEIMPYRPLSPGPIGNDGRWDHLA